LWNCATFQAQQGTREILGPRMSVRALSLPTPRPLRPLDAVVQPLPAVPIDLLRILVGGLALIWFAQALADAPDFANPDGLIDHVLVQKLFSYTRLGFFQPGIPLVVLQAIIFCACLGCVGLILGYHTRVTALFLYLVAVSLYRWEFLVIHIDDAIVHLMLFWLILLPTGRTLTLTGWRGAGPSVLAIWRRTRVPGLAVRCFAVNLALIYVVAGAWKWTSPMWRSGTALYVALQMPISRAPDFWRPEFVAPLVAVNYGTLLFEPLFPVMYLLPAGHRLKRILLIGTVAFHIAIAFAMKIPYANLALVAACVVAFREEIVEALPGGPVRGATRTPNPGPDASGLAALGFVVLLAAAMLGEATVAPWRAPTRADPAPPSVALAGSTPAHGTAVSSTETGGHNLLYAPLWLIGIAQSYRLFDWVDDRNWDIRYQVLVTQPDGNLRAESSEKLFPGETHHILLQSYMQGVTWGPVPASHVAQLRSTLMYRYARRYCQRERTIGVVDSYVLVRRITMATSSNPSRVRELFMRFECRSGDAMMLFPPKATRG
jgi:hypothetical protein